MTLKNKEDFDKIAGLLASYQCIKVDIIKVYLSILKKRNFKSKDLIEFLEEENRFEPQRSYLSESNINRRLIKPLLKNELLYESGKNQYSPVNPISILNEIQGKIMEDNKFLESIKDILSEIWEYSDEDSKKEINISCNFKNLKGFLSDILDNKSTLKEI